MKQIRNIIIITCSLILCLIFSLNLISADNKAGFENELIEKGLVNIQELDPSIKVDLKYSTPDNFLGEDVYGDLNSCYLYKEIALKLMEAQKELKKMHPNYSLIVYDGVRPRRIQYRMWKIVEGTDKQKYVANPKSGSIHNYGCAVDLSIIDESNNTVLDMGTPFDFFGDLAQPRYEEKFLKEGKLNAEQVKNRELLRYVMNKAGFTGIMSEWWHFNGFPKDVVKAKYKIVE